MVSACELAWKTCIKTVIFSMWWLLMLFLLLTCIMIALTVLDDP